MKKIIDLTNFQEDVNTLERLHYETNARENIIALMTNNGMMNSSSYEKYWNEYMELFKEYQKAKDAIADKFVTPEVGEDANASWEINFEKKVITIYD